jgi:succinylarginine dihydrolase
VANYLENVRNSSAPINEVRYFDLRESMKNGGGPACLRLRVALSQPQLQSIKANVLLNDELYQQLVDWVNHHYRDSLAFEELRDPALIDELKTAMSSLEEILKLKGLYKLS